MNKRAKLQEQFLQEPVAIQLSILATNLARIEVYSVDSQNEAIVRHLLDESRFFIEWVTPSLDNFDQQYTLANYQRQLTQWLHQWQLLWVDPSKRGSMATETHQWAEWVWQISGLRELAIA